MQKFLARLFGSRASASAALPPAVPKTDQSTDSHETIEFRPLRGGDVARGTVSWRTGPDTWLAFKVWDGPDASASGIDLFEALTTARQSLEKAGFIPMIEGARADSFPSGMARGMGEGEMTYRLRQGVAAEQSDLRFLFDPAEAETVTTTEEQVRAYRRWLASLPDEEE